MISTPNMNNGFESADNNARGDFSHNVDDGFIPSRYGLLPAHDIERKSFGRPRIYHKLEKCKMVGDTRLIQPQPKIRFRHESNFAFDALTLTSIELIQAREIYCGRMLLKDSNLSFAQYSRLLKRLNYLFNKYALELIAFAPAEVSDIPIPWPKKQKEKSVKGVAQMMTTYRHSYEKFYPREAFDALYTRLKDDPGVAFVQYSTPNGYCFQLDVDTPNEDVRTVYFYDQKREVLNVRVFFKISDAHKVSTQIEHSCEPGDDCRISGNCPDPAHHVCSFRCKSNMFCPKRFVAQGMMDNVKDGIRESIVEGIARGSNESLSRVADKLDVLDGHKLNHAMDAHAEAMTSIMELCSSIKEMIPNFAAGLMDQIVFVFAAGMIYRYYIHDKLLLGLVTALVMAHCGLASKAVSCCAKLMAHLIKSASDTQGQTMDEDKVDLLTGFTAICGLIAAGCGVKAKVKDGSQTMKQFDQFLRTANSSMTFLQNFNKLLKFAFAEIFYWITGETLCGKEEQPLIERMNKFMEKATHLVEDNVLQKLPFELGLYHTISDLMKEGELILRDVQYSNLPKRSIAPFMFCMNQIATLWRESSAYHSSNKRVHVPVWVYMAGGTSMGKSNFKMMLTTYLLEKRKQRYTDESIYERNKTGDQHFWDAYRDNWCITIDDLFQIDNKDIRAEQAVELIHMVNAFQFPLNRAGILEKGNSFFNAKIVMTSTNMLSLGSSLGIASMEAFGRRRDFVAYIDLDPEIMKKGSKWEVDTAKMDSKYGVFESANGKTDIHPKAWRVHLQDKLIDITGTGMAPHDHPIDFFTFAKMVDDKLEWNQNPDHNITSFLKKGNVFFDDAGNPLTITTAEERRVLAAEEKVKERFHSAPECPSREQQAKAVNEELARIRWAEIAAEEAKKKKTEDVVANGRFEFLRMSVKGKEKEQKQENEFLLKPEDDVVLSMPSPLGSVSISREIRSDPTSSMSAEELEKIRQMNIRAEVIEKETMEKMGRNTPKWKFWTVLTNPLREKMVTVLNHPVTSDFTRGLRRSQGSKVNSVSEIMGVFLGKINSEYPYLKWFLLGSIVGSILWFAYKSLRSSFKAQGNISGDKSTQHYLKRQTEIRKVFDVKEIKDTNQVPIKADTSQGDQTISIEGLPINREMFQDTYEEVDDKQASEQMYNSVVPNLSRIIVLTSRPDGSMFTCQQNLLFVKGRQAVTSAHLLPPFVVDNPDTMVWVSDYNGPGVLEYLSSVQKHFWKDADLVTLCFGNRFRPRLDLTRKFMVESKMSAIDNGHFVTLTKTVLDYESKTELTVKQKSIPVIQKAVGVRHGDYTVDEHSLTYNTLDGFQVKGLTSVIGDCGGVYMLFDKKRERKLFGIHTAFSKTNGACGVYVSQERLERNLISGFRENIVKEPIPVVDAAPQMSSTIFPEPLLSLAVLGKVDHGTVFNAKTNIRPSVIHERFTKCDTAPALLHKKTKNGVVIDPVLNGLHKWNRPLYLPASEVLEKVKEVCKFLPYMWQKADNTVPNVCDDREALHGLGCVKRMELTTSAGYTLNHMAHKEPGKKSFVKILTPNEVKERNISTGDEDCYESGELLKAMVNDRIALALKGIIARTYWADSLKDERLELEKVDQGGTRYFMTGDLDYTLTCRRFFMRFTDHIMKNRSRLACKVGVNPDGQEWSEMWKWLNEVNEPKFIAGDFKKYDMSLPTWLVEPVVDAILNWFKMNDEKIPHKFYNGEFDNRWLDLSMDDQNKVRFVLMQDIMQATRINGKFVYQSLQGVPSGHFLTAIFNSIVNEVIIRTCISLCCKITMEEISKHFRIATYGDDHIIAVDKKYHYFNQQLLQKAIKMFFGMDYTDSTKSLIVDEWTPVEKLTFLQRYFRRDGKQVFAPLKKDIVDEMINWIRESEYTPDEATFINMNTALREWFHYGKEIFDAKLELFNQVAFMRRWQRFTVQYDVLYGEWLNK